MTTAGSSPVDTDARLQRDILRRLAALELERDPTAGGTVRMTIADTAPAGWALLDGSTITNCETLYPDTWAAAPAGWKSGSNLILADMRGRVPLMADGSHALGSLGGANSRTIAAANLPSHTHSGTTGTVSNDHSHGFSGSTASDGTHYHLPYAGAGNFLSNYGEGSANAGLGDDAYALSSRTNVDGAHSHAFSGNTGGISANHNHGFTTDGGTGSGTALDTTPAYASLNFIVRLR